MMKNLIIDFIKRWKWWLAGAMAVHFFYIVVVLLEAKTNFWMWILAVAVPTFVSCDHQRGAMRVHSLLPVPRKTLANAYWIQAVLLPTVVVSIGMLIASIVIGIFKRSALGGLGSIPYITVLTFAFSGTLYFIFTIMPQGPHPGLWSKLLGGVALIGWGFVFVQGMLLSSDEFIHHWGPLEPIERILFAVGIVLGIVSFFTSRRLVRYLGTLRAGTHTVREKTQARRIRFPERTAGLLEPWFTTLWSSLAGFLLFTGTLSLICIHEHNWNTAEAMREILGKPGTTVGYGLLMVMAFALVAGIRSLWALRLARTLPLTGWGLTGVIVSFPMVSWLAAWIAVFTLFLTLGRLDTLSVFAKVLLVSTGPLFLSIGLLVRYGPKYVFAGMVVIFPLVALMGILWWNPGRAGSPLLSWPSAAFSALLLSGFGIWTAHGAITCRSRTYRPSNFIAPGGMGR